MSRFERELLQWLRQHRADVVTGIASTGKLSDEAIESLKTGVAEFKQLFQSGATGTRVNELRPRRSVTTRSAARPSPGTSTRTRARHGRSGTGAAP